MFGLCANCARFGTVLDSPPPPPPRPAGGAPPPYAAGRVNLGRRSLEERDLFQEMPELELVPDWGRRIREAREKLTWTPEELAKRLNEKKSVVLKLESGSFHPPDATVRKVERLLHVRLRANPGEVA
ncbi:MAG: helix-turn-helix domain-containing protein [Thermoplasmata archaeon]|nr:helix-turn-helix domain-containing protein [Thermoplasmata archaeon]MCI4341246.1 helix-turn-helix domain-containing protein [Thermoplasmata archaeon]